MENMLIIFVEALECRAGHGRLHKKIVRIFYLAYSILNRKFQNIVVYYLINYNQIVINYIIYGFIACESLTPTTNRKCNIINVT